jgi:hypothetical protein
MSVVVSVGSLSQGMNFSARSRVMMMLLLPWIAGGPSAEIKPVLR